MFERLGQSFTELMTSLFGERLWGILTKALADIVEKGLPNTLLLTGVSFSVALVIATLVAIIQYRRIPVLRQIARFYIWLIRGTPLLVQLLVVFYALPAVGIVVNPIPAAIIAFSINEGAYCSETMRAALESVPVGQVEAGLCVGMSYPKVMLRIVLPQAMRTAVPNLFNSLISMVKDTSLVSNITVVDMFMVTKRSIGRTYEFLALYILLALLYLAISTVMELLQHAVERLLNKKVGREVKSRA